MLQYNLKPLLSLILLASTLAWKITSTTMWKPSLHITPIHLYTVTSDALHGMST